MQRAEFFAKFAVGSRWEFVGRSTNPRSRLPGVVVQINRHNVHGYVIGHAWLEEGYVEFAIGEADARGWRETTEAATNYGDDLAT